MWSLAILVRIGCDADFESRFREEEEKEKKRWVNVRGVGRKDGLVEAEQASLADLSSRIMSRAPDL